MAASSTSGILVRRTFRSCNGASATPFRFSRLASCVVSTCCEPSARVVMHPPSGRAVQSAAMEQAAANLI